MSTDERTDIELVSQTEKLYITIGLQGTTLQKDMFNYTCFYKTTYCAIKFRATILTLITLSNII
jgi:hypothetical protein